jgi:hypothetical protein
MINSWRKVLSKTDIGEGGTHDKYLNIPKKIKINGEKISPFIGKDENPTQFYNRQPGRPGKENWVFVNHIDKITGDIYKVRFEFARVSKQTRLYQLAECYNARKPKEGDIITVEKITVDNETNFIVDIERNGSSINVLSPSEREKSLKSKKILKRQLEPNIFLQKINPGLDRYASGKTGKSTDIIKKAQIYKITYSINNKTFVYVGQDKLCRGVNYYFGSSILTTFCQLAYERNIFKKEILFELDNIVKKKLDKMEWDCIYEVRRECKKKGWHNINGKVQE